MGGPVITVQFNNRRPSTLEGTRAEGRPVTLYRLWRCDGACRCTALEGTTIPLRRQLLGINGLVEIGGVSLRRWFEDMVHQGLPHHVFLVREHRAEMLRSLTRLMGWTWQAGWRAAPSGRLTPRLPNPTE